MASLMLLDQALRGRPLLLLPCGVHSQIFFGHLSSDILCRWLYHTNCFSSTLSMIVLSKSIIYFILSFRTRSNLEIPQLLRRKSICKDCNFFLFASVISHLSIPTSLFNHYFVWRSF
jgi:hypothetical protein